MSSQDLLNCFYVVSAFFLMVLVIFIPAWFVADIAKEQDKRKEEDRIDEENFIRIFASLASLGGSYSQYGR